MKPAGWQRRLTEYLARHADTPFAWGVHDCATFAWGALCAVRDLDAEYPLAGAYRSARGAFALLGRGGRGQTVLCSVLGPEIAPWRAERGDIVRLSAGMYRLKLGVADGRWVFGPGKDGLVRAPIAEVVSAWRV